MQRKIYLILTSLFVLGLFGGPVLTSPLAHAAETEGQATAENTPQSNYFATLQHLNPFTHSLQGEGRKFSG
jgi:hypothetical protein